MKVKDFLKKMNFDSDVVLEICDVTISLDNRTTLPRRVIFNSKTNPYADRKFQSFSCLHGKLILYIE